MSTRVIGFLAFAGACGILAGSRGVHADSDQIFADGFDGPKWYVDADGDTYGNPAVFVRSASQPPGYVANALDCDDTNAAIHPGAADDPDASFVDSNCDGIDGDIAKAIFVASSGTDSPTCGTQAGPCHSPAFAIGRLSAQRTQIYLQVGAYSGALTVSANAAFYGGYDIAWQRGPVTAGGPNTRFAGSIAAMGTHGAQAHAVYVPAGIQAVLADLEIDAPDTTATSNGNGANSYAVYADQNANVQLSRDRIVAGTAAEGAAGSPGVDAAQDAIAAASAGGPGMEYSIACDATSHGVGGAASTNSCTGGRSVVAGKGGDGGTMDTSCQFGVCNNCNATAGAAGGGAETIDGTSGTGGTGGSGGSSCGPTQAGFPGAVGDGSGGLKGLGSLLIDGQWTADAGGSGTLGDNGGGGGGGGGAGGCDTGTDSYGAGGGGGGAGGCAATGVGSGGGGGGGSFGVFVYSATAAIDNSVIVLGQGGSGGKGGAAGMGQPGGAGGLGGISNTGDAPNGGNGGDGGRGGVAGGGGGGQGGSVYGIYSFASSITSTGNSFAGGTPGAGGSGGTSVAGPGAGQDGQSGIVANAGSCITPSACD